MVGIILWLAIGAAFVLFLEWRISRMYPGGREALEAKAGWQVTPQFRAFQQVMIALTWPYWAWGVVRHEVRMLLLWLRLLLRLLLVWLRLR